MEIVKAAKDAAAAAANSSNQNHYPPIESLSNNSFDSTVSPECSTKEIKKVDGGNNSDDEDSTASALEKALNKIHARAALKT